LDARVDDRLGGVPTPARMEELLQELMRGVNAMFLQSMGNTVRHGPFRGMIIPTPDEESWVDGNFSCKILGAYEFELHDAIAHAVSRKPATVINVGCADGYYAIGLARMMPASLVMSYDTNQTAVDVFRKYAKLNEVADRVEIFCGRLKRSDEGEGHRLYIVDIEGDELHFIDLQENPRLAFSDLIVECHDFVDKDISLTLANRLAKTHAVEIIRARLPLYSRYEFLSQSPGVMQVLALTEKRPMPTLWLACWANEHA
jgi:hypothetical protein